MTQRMLRGIKERAEMHGRRAAPMTVGQAQAGEACKVQA
jgi:hypothetical protein